MTTIILATKGKRSRQHQVFGNYEGRDDRFTFGLKTFDDLSSAERHAHRMMEMHRADHFARTTND